MLNSILAYIDPSSGSILLQVLIGSIAGGAIVFRQFLTWPVRMLYRR